MKKINKKGIGLVASMVTVTVLLIMIAGLIQITNYSRSSTLNSVRKIEMYWAAESASNYNVNWWVNQIDTVRVEWPSVYSPPADDYGKSVRNEFNDIDSKYMLGREDIYTLPGARGIAERDSLFLHVSSIYEGNASESNSELENIDGKKLLTMRYKGPRINVSNHQAVWVLDSYAWDPETNDISNIIISNVYNTKPGPPPNILQNAEALVGTMYGAGINNRKGIFYEWDYRYGKCYFNDIIRFDYKSGSSKRGPTFYGPVTSASKMVSCYGASVNYDSGKGLYDDLSLTTAFGVFAEDTQLKNEYDSDDKLMKESFLGGYYANQPPIDTENVVWTWDDIIDYQDDYGIYVIPEDKFNSTDFINVVLRVVEVGEGITTVADIYKNIDDRIVGMDPDDIREKYRPVVSIPVNKASYGMIAVPALYEDVSIQGESSDDFTLVTEANNIYMNGDFYIHELDELKNKLEDLSDAEIESPSEALLAGLYDYMADIHPDAHLSIMANLNADDPDNGGRENSFFINSEEFMFWNCAMVSYKGDLAAGPRIGTSNNNSTAFYNIGSLIILDQQEEQQGANSLKMPNVLVQDERYMNEDEPIPLGWGTTPSLDDPGSYTNLNRQHTWFNPPTQKGHWKEVAWRFF